MCSYTTSTTHALPGWDAAAERRDAQGEFHSAAQARAWAARRIGAGRAASSGRGLSVRASSSVCVYGRTKRTRVESIFHWYLEQRKNDRSGCLADVVVALPRLEVGVKPQAPGSWSQLPALWVWLVRLTKSLASTFAESTRQPCLRRYSLREVRTPSLCLGFSWSKFFFFLLSCVD
jgi:hypothetical protein